MKNWMILLNNSPKNKTDTFCILPWVHIAAKPTGELCLCCEATERVTDGTRPFRLGTDKISAIWNSDSMKETRRKMLNGERVSQCDKCYKIEEGGGTSKRMNSNRSETPTNIDDIIAYSTEHDGEANTQPGFFDLRLGNLCNLKCRMCNIKNSSQIQKEFENARHGMDKKTIALFDMYIPEDMNSWFLDDAFWNDLETYIPHINHLYFTGGEPTIIDQHYKLLERVIELGYNDKIKLRYNTNATNVQPRFLNVIEKFSHVNLTCSIDGYGKVNDYIRSPSDWNSVSQNIIKYIQSVNTNAMLSIGMTVQALNILRIGQLCEWIDSLNNTYKCNIFLNFGMLSRPRHLSLDILTPELREKALEHLSTLNTNCIADDLDIVTITKNLQSPMPDDIIELREKFKNHMHTLDNLRGETLLDAIPEMRSIVED